MQELLNKVRFKIKLKEPLIMASSNHKTISQGGEQMNFSEEIGKNSQIWT